MLDRERVGERGYCDSWHEFERDTRIRTHIFWGSFLIEFSLILLLEGVFLGRYCLMRLENHLSYKTSAYGTLIRKD